MFPSAEELYPLFCKLERTVFLKNIITRKNIVVGDYTYYDDENDVYNFEKNVKYHYDFLEDNLIIGNFCQIAQGATFLMNGIFHNISHVTTFPFGIFDESIAKTHPEAMMFPNKGDTVVGNDVWIGYGATFMPGIKIGDGAIIGAGALVTKDIEAYTIVGGNPAKVIRKRFSDETIERLLKIRWWDWPIEKITQNIDAFLKSDIEKLEKISENS